MLEMIQFGIGVTCDAVFVIVSVLVCVAAARLIMERAVSYRTQPVNERTETKVIIAMTAFVFVVFVYSTYAFGADLLKMLVR